MHPRPNPLLLLLRPLLELPVRAVTRLADEADEIWEPFLVDDPAVAGAALGTGR